MSIKSLVEKAALFDLLESKLSVDPDTGVASLDIKSIVNNYKVGSIACQEFTESAKAEIDSFIKECQKQVFDDSMGCISSPVWSLGHYFHHFYESGPNQVVCMQYWDEDELEDIISEANGDRCVDFYLSLEDDEKSVCKQEFIKKMANKFDNNCSYDHDAVLERFHYFMNEKINHNEDCAC